MTKDLDDLIRIYQARAKAAKRLYLAGGDCGQWRYYSGLLEGLRIARRTSRTDDVVEAFTDPDLFVTR